MADTDIINVCRSCGFQGTENYCSRCGQPYKTKRISLPGLLHDVFHFFTHLDKGFAYTLKMLITAPGTMQRTYIEGERSRHQKPFSMFFICATVAALSRYWIFSILFKYYHAGNVSEATFYHEYLVIFHVVLLPLHVFVAYLFFYKSGYNYAETGILILYNLSFFFIASIVISLLKFIWVGLDTAYIELPVFLIYNTIAFINFYRHLPRWKVILKSLIIIVAAFFLIQVVEDFVVQLIS